MNEHIARALSALEEYYRSPLPETEEQWDSEAADLHKLPGAEKLAVKRRRAAFGTPINEAAELFRSLAEEQD